jgi:hypothetical protein
MDAGQQLVHKENWRRREEHRNFVGCLPYGRWTKMAGDYATAVFNAPPQNGGDRGHFTVTQQLLAVN